MNHAGAEFPPDYPSVFSFLCPLFLCTVTQDFGTQICNVFLFLSVMVTVELVELRARTATSSALLASRPV